MGVPVSRVLRQLFSVYPTGLPGVGLLLLRIGVGAALAWRLTLDDLVSAVGGALLVAGFLTPLVALAMAAFLAISAYRLSPPVPELSILLLIGGCASLALLGPGARSIDAHIFGRREIVIARRAGARSRGGH